MKLAILLNRPHAGLRTLGKRVLAAGYDLARLRRPAADPIWPEFDALPRLVDAHPVVLGTEGPVDWTALERVDAIVWEWGWTATPPERALEIKRRTGLPLVVFPGPLDRFWREVDPRHLSLHTEALRATDAVAAMLRDTLGFYAALAPHAHVFHMPVPVDTARLAALAVPAAERDPDRVLLTAPTRFTGTATQLPITTFAAFARLRAARPGLRGLCFCYDAPERAETERMLDLLGLAGCVEVRDYVRPLARFLDLVRTCGLALALPHGMIQGRTALMLACLGVPAVTSDDVDTHRALYPDTSVRWHDVDGAAAAAARLLDDPAFAARVAAGACAAVAYYDVAAARRRLAAALAAVVPGRALREGA
jgi:hypothetical protein